MADMLAKQEPWAFGCDCSQCMSHRERQARRQAARQREKRQWLRDVREDA